jgi:hypothetical protein
MVKLTSIPRGRQQIGWLGFTLLIRHVTSPIFNNLPEIDRNGARTEGEQWVHLARV